MKFIKYSIIMLAVFMMASCHKDDPGTTEVGEVTTSTPVVNVATTGDVLGYVYDEDNNPVANATVTALKSTTTTDQYGVFKFKNIELDQEGTYIKAIKNGYILGSDLVSAIEGVNHTSRIKMMRLDVTGSFSSSDGGSVNIEGGGQVNFAPSSIVKADGSAYNGTVRVTAKRLATDDPNMADLMPGGLVANDAEGRTVALGSMGMVAVELRDASGNELNIASGKTADVTFPIADFQKGAAPDEIKLWSFDEGSGLWEEEGKAVRDGDSYRASVSHFSFWNCDAPFPLVNICGKVLYSDGTPASNLYILILTELYGCGYGRTNEDGTFSGKVPKNQILTIKITNPLCNGEEEIIEIEVGPFSNKTVLDDIIIDIPVSLSFEGQVVCGTDPVDNATVLYSYGGSTFTVESSEDGSFSINISDECGEAGAITVFAVDPATGNASGTLTLTPNNEDFILQVCNDCGFTVDIVDDPSGDICIEQKLKVEVDGNGTYTYLWSNGSTDESVVTAPTPTGEAQYCVTVTESTLECSMSKCITVENFKPIDGELGSFSDCDTDGGSILIFISGGHKPYTYEWSEPGLVVENDSIVNNVPGGTYTLTVIDAEGCTKTFDVTVQTGDPIEVDLSYTSLCYEAEIVATVSGGNPDYFYSWSGPNQGQTQGSTFFAWQSGDYCVTVTDANGCFAEECIVVVIDDPSANVFVDATNCTGGTYTVENLSAIDVSINLWYAGENYEIPFGSSIDIDFISGGFYELNGFWYSETLGCEGDGIFFNLPALLSPDSLITVAYVPPSCQGCSDGSITTNDDYLTFERLNGAVPDEIFVINSDYVDVSMEAEAGTLTEGTYYVVVTDQNTGCYIYSEKIIL